MDQAEQQRPATVYFAATVCRSKEREREREYERESEYADYEYEPDRPDPQTKRQDIPSTRKDQSNGIQ